MLDKVKFDGKILFVGFGSIAQGTLPLIFKHFNVTASKVQIVTSDFRGKEIAEEFKVELIVKPLKKDNFQDILDGLLEKGDFLVNLSVDVCSVSLASFCQNKQVFYLDTCIEPWVGGYEDENKTLSERSNYWLRESALKLKKENSTTAVITHGANPGLVSHFTKQALLNIAKDSGKTVQPKNKLEWAELANSLGVKVIHVAERDTQVSSIQKKEDEFVNTWSVDGFISEGAFQPAELGWGSHELKIPTEGKKHDFGNQSSIYLERPGMNTRVKTWVAGFESQVGYLVTHSESISLSDFLTLKKDDKIIYRPTVHYAYHPVSLKN
jgi:homospermidine synthase